MKKIVYIDSEISSNKKICDLGAITDDGVTFHNNDVSLFMDFVSNASFVVGHNIVNFDLKFISNLLSKNCIVIDTLYMSPLLFPEHPYHSLGKKEKLKNEELNNPLNDAKKCRDLFQEELVAFNKLDDALKGIFGSLLSKFDEFKFFDFVKWDRPLSLKNKIKKRFKNLICENADLDDMIKSNPIELAYALAIISIFQNSHGKQSITPFWVLHQFPYVEVIIKKLRGTPCKSCEYCKKMFDAKLRLKEIFGYDDYRSYNGENLQEKAVVAALNRESLVAVFPTGGGKSITFQVPAIIDGETEHALTVVISPLQSLMKDQVDNLEKKGIYDAVTINGLLNPIDRANAINRVKNGEVSILYISPESLRSVTIKQIMLSRNIARFVIDEAHCFSSWGQDFRVDYQFIGDFIKNICTEKHLDFIPVSCFTATAKQKVISDICVYFKEKLGLDLNIYATRVTRANLHYKILPMHNENEKYYELRNLIEIKNCPTIVFVSSVKNTIELSNRLSNDGTPAKPFNGKMDRNEKIENQNAYMNNDCRVMVATSAFGMGVDKADIGLVVHYDISDSLENYIQEAGRAGRDQSIDADCYVLFCEDDLNKHFSLLNISKITISEIQQVWKGIKSLSQKNKKICYSSLEIARASGWDGKKPDFDTRIKTILNALENAGYIKRGFNSPHVFADGILAKNVQEAMDKIERSGLFEKSEHELCRRVITKLISKRSIAKAGNAEAESRIDYIADTEGIDKTLLINLINRMKTANVLADSKDMSAVINDNEGYINNKLTKYIKIEKFMLDEIEFFDNTIDLKDINDRANKEKINGCSIREIMNIIYFWISMGYIKNERIISNIFQFIPCIKKEDLERKIEERIPLAEYIIDNLLDKMSLGKKEETINFSVAELVNGYNNRESLFAETEKTTVKAVEDILLYFSKLNILKLEGGFLVYYGGIQIERLISDNHIMYKQEDYKQLKKFYDIKIQQIHIVGEFANMMLRNYSDALKFVEDYFSLSYDTFINTYFKGRKKEIEINISPKQYQRIFGTLSDTQKDIIENDESNCISVVAGPGSGKTTLLVRKLASLLLLEDVKPEQLLMLTFSRLAATDFKQKLIDLIKDTAYYVDIKTFHSFCFDILGLIGSEEKFGNIITEAIEKIKAKEIEQEKITKTVLVIDEAQDMDSHEYELIKQIIDNNENIRVIAVGDDDQNIFEFRGASSKYMVSLIMDYNAQKYELVENFRSDRSIINLANAFGKTIENRLKNSDISCTKQDNGVTNIIKYATEYMFEGIVNRLVINKGESTAILTKTNEEALIMLGILKKRGINAKLIQSNEGFSLFNLQEVRFFYNCINNTNLPLVDVDSWQDAKKRLSTRYSRSTCLSIIINMLNTFEKTNKKIYKTDFIRFVRESNLDDFIVNNKQVIVSTIHKAKGREFDNVNILLNNPTLDCDEERRKVYVAITRAKHQLSIYINNGKFDKFKNIELVNYQNDYNKYSKPVELIDQLSHKDVFLSFFKNHKKTILQNIQAGDKLEVSNDGLLYNNGLILKFSSKYKEKIQTYKQSGYVLKYALVNYVVAWKGEEDIEESAIILPSLYYNYSLDSIKR